MSRPSIIEGSYLSIPRYIALGLLTLLLKADMGELKVLPLTDNEASTVLCSAVVKHAGSGRVRKKCRGKQDTRSSVFPYFLSEQPLPASFTTEQSTVEDSLFVV